MMVSIKMSNSGFLQKLKFEHWLLIIGAVVALIVLLIVFLKTPSGTYRGTVKEIKKVPILSQGGSVLGHDQVVTFSDGTEVTIDNYVPWKVGCEYEIEYKKLNESWVVKSHKKIACGR